ncbi:uncharacterized protein LOC133520989 [Cydia pomonella]|uniref:uncharacterized protein LOC133520989 n=1 Tax=Cydia pomonella TaxID=82600 RepID=UPI002ADE3206|nr:uncharacterized protein LOC133520989 [Cydia pomonella]
MPTGMDHPNLTTRACAFVVTLSHVVESTFAKVCKQRISFTASCLAVLDRGGDCNLSNENKAALKVDDLLKFIRDRADMLETLLVTHSRSNTNSTYPQHDAKKSYTHNAQTAPKDEKEGASDKRSVALLATDNASRSPSSSSSITDNNIAHAQHVLQVSNAHIDEDVYARLSSRRPVIVVYDASAPTTSGKSLNDIQRVGAPIQGDLIAILLRFRENRFVACADIEKHYRQVLIDESQRDLQLILWRDNPCDNLDIYQLSTVTYGTAAAAFLSCRCLKQLALECNDPEVARTIRDDLISGSSTIPELLRICDETAKVLSSGCFPLRKWVFNFDCTDQRYNDDTSKELSLGEHAHSKTLGLGWYNKSDELFYHTRHESNPKPVTKRIILSTASQVFDPLGLLSPMIIIAKCLLQRLFLLKVDWDAAVPDDVTQAWHRFVNNLAILPSIRIPRHVMCNDHICIELHIFSDASQLAYGTCAYVRTIDDKSAVTVRLLCSKSKVAPISPPLSTPRLEMSACLLGAKLYNKIKESFRAKFNRVIFYTDSTIALSWLRMQPNLLKPFVQNRVAEIHEITKEHSWHHVSGKCNPADLVSRGVQLDALRTSSLWWTGPDFLHDINYNAQSVDPSLLLDESQIPERKTNPMTSLVCNDNNNNNLFTFDRFSQFNRMQRAAAYVLRFIHNARNKDARRTGALTVDGLRESEILLSHLSQLESLSDVHNDRSIYCSRFARPGGL